jgi:putative endonuclease
VAKWKRGGLSRCARSGTARQNSYTEDMYYVYFLKSLKNGDLYIGSTENIEKRVILHNAGRVKSTKGYLPWELLGYEKFSSRAEAVMREKFLKNHQQKEILKRKYGMVL